MSSFTAFDTMLQIAYHGKHKRKNLWQVIDGFSYYLQGKPDHIVRVPDQFITDGASVPRLLWWLIPPWGDYGQSAVLHDYLLEVGKIEQPDGSVRVLATRSEARKHFDDSMKVMQVLGFKRKLIVAGTRLWDLYKGDVIKRTL